MSTPQNDKIEGAPRVEGAEHGDNESDLKWDEPVLLKSSHDTLGYWKTARVFWKVRYIRNSNAFLPSSPNLRSTGETCGSSY